MIPSEWAIEPSLEFFPLSATLASPQEHVRLTASHFEDLGGGVHEFTVDLASARYIIVMRAASHSWLVDVEPGAASRLDLRLPPPVQVIVTVTGAGSDEAVDDETLWITCEGWNGKEGMAISQVKRYAVGGGFEYRCPRGPVLIKVSAVGFNSRRRIVDVTSSPHRETIVLEPHMGVDITVMRDGAPWPEAWEDGDLEYTLEYLDPIPRRRGEVVDERRVFRSHFARTSVPHAGRYRLRVTSVPKGRDAAPELDVVVEKRAYTAVTLNL